MAPQKPASLPKSGSFVIANNDIVYLWWSIPEKIDGCLGFSIRRIIDGKEEDKALPATVKFDNDKVKDKRKSPQTTNEWPVQSFNWKDLYAPVDKTISYKIVPMIGTWDKLIPDETNAILTGTVRRTQKYGDYIKVIFNRGLLSTQAFAKSNGEAGPTKQSAGKLLEESNGEWRRRLGGQMLFNVNEFFQLAGANGGGKYYAALYELTDKELIKHLTDAEGTELILSNANKSKKQMVDGKEKSITIDDGTNAETRKALHKLMKQGKFNIYDRMLGTHIGHNKFVIFVDEKNKPKSILTGSTNWTPTGLCGQTNNMVVIHSEKIAGQYMKYWNELKKDKKQGADLRTWCAENSFAGTSDKTKIKLWYSPNTVQTTKPAKNPPTPVDMQELFSLIDNAKKSVLFLVFNPGSPSIINHIREVAAARPKNNPLFVRGAISDAKMSKQVTTEIYSANANVKPDKYYVGSEKITGVAAIPGTFGSWEKELLSIGYATIHDKIMVIDPFEKDAVVVTASHNLGYTASYKNDENMVIIRNNPEIAKAYAAHVLDIVNHFKWRYLLQSSMKKGMTEKEKRAVLEKQWHGLDPEDKWMDRYFGKKGFIDQYRLFLR